jgi:hypothetical protein
MRVLLACFLLLICIPPAQGHDPRQPSLDQWYGSLMRPHTATMGGGTSCCSKDDCHTTDAELREGEWWARIGTPRRAPDGVTIVWEPGAWVKVPNEIIIRGPNGNAIANPAGEAVLCQSSTWINNIVDPNASTLFCFVPPNES